MTNNKKQPYDEFNPTDYAKKKDKFWMLPQGVAALEHLSPGAKILYASLFSLAMKYGKAFAYKETLQQYLGNPSKRTLLRWQNELIDEGLLRVLQKGRGMANSYYFLRHPALGNAEVGEFEPGARPLYRDRKHNTQTIVTEEQGLYIFEDSLREWYEVNSSGGFMELPKPGIKINASQRRELEMKWQRSLADAILNGTSKISPFSSSECNTSSDQGTDTQALSMNSSTEPLNYDSVFTSESSNAVIDEKAMKLSDEPVKTTLPTGRIIQTSSPRACYLAAMKRRKEREEKIYKEFVNGT